MKQHSYRVIAGGLVASFLLVSCGGGGDETGGDEAGDEVAFVVSPANYTLTLSAGSRCRNASRTPPIVVTIIGGQAPFRIINSYPGTLVIDKTEATGKDPQFKVSYSESAIVCAKPGVVTVLDYYSRSTSFEYTVEIEESQ